MKITLLAPVASMSGGARVISIYAAELARLGCDVTVVVGRGWRPTLRGTLRDLRRGHFKLRRGPGASHYDGIEPLVTRVRHYGPITAADCPDADVIVATWWETAAWMREMPAAKGRQFHFVQGYEAFNDEVKPKVDAVLALPVPKITISGWLLAMLRERGNRDVTLIPNGVDRGQFHAPPRGRQARSTVGMLYHHAHFKNAAGAIAAFERLREQAPDAQLVAFGEEGPVDAIPLPPGTAFHRSPAQDAIRDIYAACDVWLCSSRLEGFHLPPLEAMACRCPVISTPVGGPQDIVVDGENGWLVPHDDVGAMTDRLVRLFAQDEAGWRRMSDAAYATALSHDWPSAARRFLAALSPP